MKNYEKYSGELREYRGLSFCDDFVIPHILKSKEQCDDMNCSACRMLQTIWLLEDYKEPEVDWSKVKVDTPILVRDTEYEEWYRRYFSKYVNGVVCAWDYGLTSWTAVNDRAWEYAKLAESEEGGAKQCLLK